MKSAKRLKWSKEEAARVCVCERERSRDGAEESGIVWKSRKQDLKTITGQGRTRHIQFLSSVLTVFVVSNCTYVLLLCL